MKVKEIMTADAIKSCDPDTSIKKAAKIMNDNNCGALPVVDKNDKVVGIVTDRDICLSLAKNDPETLSKVTVKQIMAKKVLTVKAGDDVSEVYKQMRTYQIGRLPVTDAHGKLKGIVSLHHLINKAVGTPKQELGSFSTPDENLLKTIHAVTNRYNGYGPSQMKKKVSEKKFTAIL